MSEAPRTEAKVRQRGLVAEHCPDHSVVGLRPAAPPQAPTQAPDFSRHLALASASVGIVGRGPSRGSASPPSESVGGALRAELRSLPVTGPSRTWSASF